MATDATGGPFIGFECDYCDERFDTVDAIREHKRRAHRRYSNSREGTQTPRDRRVGRNFFDH